MSIEVTYHTISYREEFSVETSDHNAKMRMREFLTRVGYDLKELSGSKLCFKRGSFRIRPLPRNFRTQITATVHSLGRDRAGISMTLSATVQDPWYEIWRVYVEAEIKELKKALQTGKIDTLALEEHHEVAKILMNRKAAPYLMLLIGFVLFIIIIKLVS